MWYVNLVVAYLHIFVCSQDKNWTRVSAHYISTIITTYQNCWLEMIGMGKNISRFIPVAWWNQTIPVRSWHGLRPRGATKWGVPPFPPQHPGGALSQLLRSAWSVSSWIRGLGTRRSFHQRKGQFFSLETMLNFGVFTLTHSAWTASWPALKRSWHPLARPQRTECCQSFKAPWLLELRCRNDGVTLETS